MFRLAIILTLIASPALSATVSAMPVEWHGPGGPRGCDGACGRDWALDTLPTDAPRGLIEQAIAANPQGAEISVVSGDELVMMSYAIDGTPYADLRGGVAVLDAPEAATGWVVQADGETWIFAIVHGCQNWTLVRQPTFGQPHGPGGTVGRQPRDTPVSVTGLPPVSVTGLPPVMSGPRLPTTTPERRILSSNSQVRLPTIPPVPLPGSGWLVALALALTAAVGSGRRRTV